MESSCIIIKSQFNTTIRFFNFPNQIFYSLLKLKQLLLTAQNNFNMDTTRRQRTLPFLVNKKKMRPE